MHIPISDNIFPYIKNFQSSGIFILNFSILPKNFSVNLVYPNSNVNADKQETPLQSDRVTHLNNDTKHNDKPTETK